MSGYDDAYILRITGVGDSSGLYAFTSRALPYSVTGTEYAGTLATVPEVLSQRVSLLDPVGTVAGIAVDLIYGTGTKELLDARILPVTTTGGDNVRLDQATDEGIAATVALTGAPDLTAGDPVWVMGEVWKFNSYSAPNGNFTFGQLGTESTPIPYSGIGAQLMTRWPTVVGARVTLSRVGAVGTAEADEAVIYRGVITQVSSNAGRINLQIASALGALRDRPYALPSNSRQFDPPITVGAHNPTSAGGAAIAVGDVITIPLDQAGYDPADVDYAWLELEEAEGGGAKALVLASCSYSVNDAGIGQAELRGGNVVRWMELDGVIVPDSLQAQSALQSRAWTLKRASMADVIPANDPSEVVAELLTGKAPTTGRGALPADYVDVSSFGALDSVYPVEDFGIGQLYDGVTGVVMPYRKRPTTMRKVLSEVLQPLGISIAPSATGKIKAIDWAPSARGATVVSDSDMRSPLTGWTLNDSTVIREVLLQAETAASVLEHRIISDLASNVHAGGRSVNVEGGIWARVERGFDFLKTRWRALLSNWQRGAPTFAFSVARGTAIDIGDVISIRQPSLVGWDGDRYNDTAARPVLAIVMGMSPRLRGPTVEVEAVALSWGATRQDGVWGAAAEVQSYAAGVARVDGTFTGSDDAVPFATNMRVILCDEEGTRIDSGTPPLVTAIGATALTVTFSVTPVAGNLIIPAPAGDQGLTTSAEFGFALIGETFWADAGDDPSPLAGFYTYS